MLSKYEELKLWIRDFISASASPENALNSLIKITQYFPLKYDEIEAMVKKGKDRVWILVKNLVALNLLDIREVGQTEYKGIKLPIFEFNLPKEYYKVIEEYIKYLDGEPYILDFDSVNSKLIFQEIIDVAEAKTKSINSFDSQFLNGVVENYTGSSLFIFIFSGLLKAFLEANSYVCIGQPTYENIFLYSEDLYKERPHLDKGVNINVEFKEKPIASLQVNEDILNTEIERTLRIIENKYNFTPEFYAPLPFTHIHTSTGNTNICADVHPLIKVHEEYEEWMAKLPNSDSGTLPFTLGLNEALLGLIPLLERNMLTFHIDRSSGQVMYTLNMKNRVVREIYDMLKPIAGGSVIYGVYIPVFKDDNILNRIILITFPIRGRIYKKMRLLRDYNSVKEISSDEYNIVVDPLELFIYNYGIEAAGKYGAVDPRLRLELDNAIKRYCTLEERNILYKPVKELAETLYIDKIKTLKRIAERDGREWYRRFWDKVLHVKDIITDIRKTRGISNLEKKLLAMGMAQAYIYLYKFMDKRVTSFLKPVNLYFPLIKYELKMTKDYLSEYFGIKIDWSEAVKEAIGTLASAGKIGIVGEDHAILFRNYGFNLKKLKPQKRKLSKETKRDYFDFYWMQYKRALGEAKANLDAFEKFRQVYYLDRALSAYEDAKRILYDMMSRFKKDRKRYQEITNEMILLENQINDLKEFMKKMSE